MLLSFPRLRTNPALLSLLLRLLSFDDEWMRKVAPLSPYHHRDRLDTGNQFKCPRPHEAERQTKMKKGQSAGQPGASTFDLTCRRQVLKHSGGLTAEPAVDGRGQKPYDGTV